MKGGRPGMEQVYADVGEVGVPVTQTSTQETVPEASGGGSNLRGTVGYISKDQFQFLHTIGQGAYGQVYLVQRKMTGIKYALKVLEKDHILKYDKIEAVFRERDIGSDLSDHPNIVQF